MLDQMDKINDGLWLPKLVEQRLIEAARIIVYTAGPVGPRGFGSSLPRDLLEAISADPLPDYDNDGYPTPWWLATGAGADRKRRQNFSARRVTMADEAMRWPVVYLPVQDGPRRVLNLFLRCKVYRRPFEPACKKKKWPLRTAYRARDRALSLIAQGLNRDLVPVRT